MGIVKIVSGESAAQDVSSYGDEDLAKDEITLLQSFPNHESDDCEQAEVGCELAVSRGQICSIPYELYDLPELTEVLSLKTWNLCLTEDDRFHLAAYLPDMDQGDFCTTMKELFSGDDMFFGSPLRSIFHRLNGGFYSPEVSQARELLTALERRRHYHFLKLYHDGIVQKFASVDKGLRSSDMSACFGETVPISQNWGFVNRSIGLSSSSVPRFVKDGNAALYPLKRVKLMDGTLSAQCSTSHNDTVHMPTSHNDTVHMPSLAELSSSESQSIHSSRPNSSIPTKGVLKIRTGRDYRANLSERAHHIPGRIAVKQLGMQSTSFCTTPHAFTQDVHGFAENSSSRVYKISLGSSPFQWKHAPETYNLMAKSPLGVQMTVPEELQAVDPSLTLGGFYHPAANHTSPCSSELPHMKNLFKNFALDPYARVGDGCKANEYTTMHSLRNAESISQKLNVGTRIYPPNNFTEQRVTKHKYHDGLKLVKSVAEVEQSHRSPCTYSRRKLHKTSLDITDSVKSSTMVEDTVSPSVLASTIATAIKL